MIENSIYLKRITKKHYEILKTIKRNIINDKYPCRAVSCDDCPLSSINHIHGITCSDTGNIKGKYWEDIPYREQIELLDYMLSRTDYALSTNIEPAIDVNDLKSTGQVNIQKWLENYIKAKLKPVKFVVGEDNYSIMWDLSNHSFKAMKANYSKHFLQVHLDNRKGQVEQACRDFNDRSVKPQQVIDVFKKLNYFKEEM